MPHVHLVSSYRYPAKPRLDLNEVAKWLMSGPQVARDLAPFCWTYLDRPADGTVMLTWQPLQRLGNNFASDGYVWAPPEQVYTHDLGNGLVSSDTRHTVPKQTKKKQAEKLTARRGLKYTTSSPATFRASSIRFTLDDGSGSFPCKGISILPNQTSASSLFIMARPS